MANLWASGFGHTACCQSRGKSKTILASLGGRTTMRFSSLRRVVSGAVLAVAFGVLLSGAVLAQDRTYQDDRYGRYDDRNGQYGTQGRWSKDRVRDYALKLGYHQGYSEVRDMLQYGGRRSVRDIPGYRDDSNGYLGWMGYRDDYRSAYRRGFEMAYEDFTHNRARRYNREDVERVLGGNLKETYNDDRYDRYDRDDRDYGQRDDRGRDWNRDRDRNGGCDRKGGLHRRPKKRHRPEKGHTARPRPRPAGAPPRPRRQFT